MEKRRKLKWVPIALGMLLVIGIIFTVICITLSNQNKEQNNQQDKSKNITVESSEEKETTENVRDAGNSKDNASTQDAVWQQVTDKLNTMTLEEKAAQLFILAPVQLTGPVNTTSVDETTKQALEEFPVCGFIYFAENIIDPDQLLEMTTKTQNYAREINGLPLFLSTDEEGGDVARIGENANFPVAHFPNMDEIGQSRDIAKAYEAGAGIGAYLSSYGINLDYAPVADVLTEPLNTVIGERSFGNDAELAGVMVTAVMQGLEEQNVYSCLKHFPNHGATVGDTHEGYAYSNKTLEELRQEDLAAFQNGIDAGASFVMVSHISVPEVVGDNTPSTLSEQIITGILREEMGFEGIVITDAMNMGAIVNNYSPAEAAVKAIQAGVDIILMPDDFRSAYQGILNAVADGELSEARIDLSVERILAAKFKQEAGLKQTVHSK